MIEKLEFITLNQRKYFIHIHLSLKANKKAILFLNPIFDEKKRVQKFQTETARALCHLGYTVIRFDYFGSGDSEGDTSEFCFNTLKSDFPFLIDYIFKIISAEEVILLGIRIGADLAVINSLSKPKIKNLILVEPIIDGKRFLLEVRMRKKIFHSLNKINTNLENFIIHGKSFEDFQGFPMSFDNLAYLESLNLCNVEIEDKQISIFKTNSISNKKPIGKFKEMVDAKKNCFVNIHYADCPEFWSALEVIETSALTKQIVTFFKNI